MNKKIILVTGAAKGIGKGIAELLNDEYIVIHGYINTPTERKYNSVKIDVSSRESIKNALKEIKNDFNKDVDILVNNAAISQEKDFLAITDSDWEKMLNNNLKSAFMLTQEVLPSMINKKWGRIINIVSIGGQWGGYNQVHYAASKAALINFTQSIAKIYSSHGITSNAVSPGLIETDMIKNEMNTESGKEKAKNIPIGKIGKVNDVANAVKFLISPEASYITGQTINVNGGMYFG